jgi:hypothetical protein
VFNFKNSLAAFACAFLFIGALGTQLAPASSDDKDKGQRKFYLTETKHNGGQAKSACAEGYHMASIWEIHDPTNLRYNTELGFSTPDSGVGPPSGDIFDDDLALPAGWVRTGGGFSTGTIPGVNCFAWTDPAASGGTLVYLERRWDVANAHTAISPWGSRVRPCNSNWHVWCVQN